MAVEAITWVLKRARGITAGPRCVLLVLANYSDAEGWSWPSVRHLADLIEMQPNGIYSALSKLEDAGLITREKHPAGMRYQVHWKDEADSRKSGKRFTKIDKADSLKSGKPSSLTQNRDTKADTKRGPKEAALQEFESQFWPAWPKKAARKDAAKAYVAGRLKGMPSIEELLVSIKKHTGSGQWLDGFIPHAATWIRGERWSDEVELPKLSGRHAAPAKVDPSARKIKTRRTSA